MILSPITPITPIKPFESANKASLAGGENPIPFKSLFTDAVKNVTETAKVADAEVQKVVLGETDDTFSANIAAEKASLAFEMFVQLRNKSLDAYNEVMRMNV